MIAAASVGATLLNSIETWWTLEARPSQNRLQLGQRTKDEKRLFSRIHLSAAPFPAKCRSVAIARVSLSGVSPVIRQFQRRMVIHGFRFRNVRCSNSRFVATACHILNRRRNILSFSCLASFHRDVLRRSPPSFARMCQATAAGTTATP